MLGSNLQFHSNFKSTFCKQAAELDQTLHAVSDLVLHCLPMSHKMDTRLKCINFRISQLKYVMGTQKKRRERSFF